VGGVRVTRVVRASLGFVAGLVVAAVGVGLAVAAGPTLALGITLVAAGVGLSGVFLVFYDVDEPRREANP
jgi:hypothetical protein